MATVAPFKKPTTTAPTKRRSEKVKAEIARYIEYRRWRDLIHREIKTLIAKGVSFKTMSARTGLHPKTIANLAYHGTVMPRMDTVYRVLTYLGYKLVITKVKD